MNEFEKDVQYKGNDFIDSGVAFVISFGFFATIFIIATVIQVIAS
ncbi:YqzM family protein [Pallidibacillus pasinlerensis]|uniref:YqzM family protein n=1 Tax=Pallidibacillus pasinlerensis TaxID=2703818 RepID=A0ABX0A216_9BACI|nr:YqzM family protein [Pallidibacillus pasinlerensis]NCU17473.1 YqzM family protein [Pallidibacillus pasinlerensis]